MSKVKQIRPLEGYSNISDGDVVSRSVAVQTNMTGNSNYPNPPVDPAALKTATDSLSALIAESLDGSKKVIAEKNKQRKAVINMLRLLGRYVEISCKEDMAILQSSGFQPASITTAPPQPLPQPSIRKIHHGATSGQLLVQVQAVRGARSYDLRHSAIGNGGTPGEWLTQLLTSVKSPVPFSGLTPGTTYAFQVRALGKLGYTDWCDSATSMCT